MECRQIVKISGLATFPLQKITPCLAFWAFAPSSRNHKFLILFPILRNSVEKIICSVMLWRSKSGVTVWLFASQK
jgi:hypothetical protein